MRRRTTWLAGLLVLMSAAGPSHAQVPMSPLPPLLTYSALSDRNVYQRPPLPALGPAAYRFTDLTFGSKMLRATDANTRLGRFWVSPSSAETSACNTESTKLYVIGGGEVVPRANVSQDRRFALFTSNWGLTLGVGPDGFRDDAFIVQLAPAQAGP